MAVVAPTTTGRGLVGTLTVGVGAWLIISVTDILWFFARTSDPGLAGVAIFFWAWATGYLPAGLVLIVYAVVQMSRRRLGLSAGLWAALVYFLPVLVIAGAFQLFLRFQPVAVQGGSDVMRMAAQGGPTFFGLYLVGLVLGVVARNRRQRTTVMALLMPPLVGVVLAGVNMSIYTMTSAHWRHRHDFTLTTHSIEWRAPRGLVVEAELSSRVPLTVVLHGVYRDRRGTSGRHEPVGLLTVAAQGPPADDRAQPWTRTPLALKTGEPIALRMEWPHLETTSLNADREVILSVVEGTTYFSGQLVREFRIPVTPAAATLAMLEGRLSPIRQNGLWGYANAAGKIVIAPQFEQADVFSDGLAIIRIGGRDGYVGTDGRIVIPVQFARATRFSEGLAAVAHDRAYGYIDRTGATVLAYQFDAAYPFHDGLARVRVDGNDGFIDRTGRFVVPPRYEGASDFAGGLAPVKVGQRWGFIDTTGTPVVEPQFDAVQPFQQGRWHVMREGRWGAVDRAGRWTPD
jgi:hypothetical protein